MRPAVLLAIPAIALVLLSTTVGAQQKVVDHNFVGGERCRACHAAEYEAMARGPHARAFDVLVERDRKDPRCLSCHTMVPEDLSAGLTGIQCESCHGPGRYYSVDWVMRDKELATTLQLAKVDEKTCLRCHTDSTPTLLPFVYADKLELIKHWKE